MELSNHDEILQAIHDLHEVRVDFQSKDDGGATLSRVCAPMDFGPSRRAKDQTPRYHFWDLESDSGVNHTRSLLAPQITRVEVLDSTFDPSSFISWTPNWIVTRTTWGDLN